MSSSRIMRIGRGRGSSKIICQQVTLEAVCSIMRDSQWVNLHSNSLQVTLITIKQQVFRVLPNQVGFKDNRILLGDKVAYLTNMQTDNHTVVVLIKAIHKQLITTSITKVTVLKNNKTMTTNLKGEANTTSASSVNSILSILRMINTVKMLLVPVMPQ